MSKQVMQRALEALDTACSTAMHNTIAARVPECGDFGAIAQTIDYVMGELRAAIAKPEVENWNSIELRAEDAEALHMNLDAAGVPKADAGGCVYSLWGRVLRFAGMQKDWAPVPPKACIKPTHEAANAFWEYWKANGETHKHGYYESTWGAINKALAFGWHAPDAEPVGYFYFDRDDFTYKQAKDKISFPACIKLYTTPPDTEALRKELERVKEEQRLLHRAWFGHRDTGHLTFTEAVEKTMVDLYGELERVKGERDALQERVDNLNDLLLERGERDE